MQNMFQVMNMFVYHMKENATQPCTLNCKVYGWTEKHDIYILLSCIQITPQI